ncbi:MAG: dienelactone hydrolase family protein [Chloroflexi bacterium]|nr:MAG: dienelactone hydrolase family protein [Chloroflexota bacterium]
MELTRDAVSQAHRSDQEVVTISRTEQVLAHDGGRFTGYLVLPAAGSGPGLVVSQEIFGVNDYIKGVCGRLAKLGYVAMAPDLYWRLSPGIAIDEKDPNGLQQAFGYVEQLDFARAADDATAALEHLRRVPEVAAGQAGVLGFCLGGGIAYMVAALSDPVTCVSYYGSAVPDTLDLAGKVRCPILFHFGDADDYIPAKEQRAVWEAFAHHAGAEFHVHEGAGHAFDNHNAATMHHERAAREAWAQTTDFLKRTLPG